MLQWRFWAGRRDRTALALVGVFTLAIALSVMSTLTDSVTGTVAKAYEQTWRASYDILVHVPLPEGAKLPDLTEPNLLTTLPAGITLAQWAAVRQVPGVDVAAPIAVAGSMAAGPTYSVPSREIPQPPDGLYRIRGRMTSADPYVPQAAEQQLLFAFAMNSTADPQWPQGDLVFIGRPDNHSGIETSAALPVLLAGIDPESEAKLAGLDRAVTEGRYFSVQEAIDWQTIYIGPGETNAQQWPIIPIMINRAAFQSMDYTFNLEELNADLTVKRVVYQQRWGPADMVKAMADGAKQHNHVDYPAAHLMLGKSGPIRYERATSPFPDRWPTAVTVVPEPQDVTKLFPPKWFSRVTADLGPTYRAWQPANRQVTPEKRIQNNTVSYKVVGYFDSAGLTTLKDAQTHMPLTTYRPAEALQVLDAAAQPVNPPHKLTAGISPVSFLSAPPALLTTIQGAVAVAGDGVISAIQVKVAGAGDFATENVARVQQIARDIEQRTGLVAEVTMGSSPMNLLVQAPAVAGKPGFGWVEERWIHKNAGVTAVQQATFGYSAFIALILAVGVLYSLATALAGVTARRPELGVAVAVGWPGGAIARLVMGEQLMFGLAAGLLAAMAAALQGASPVRAGMLLVAAVAIYAPAMLAAGYAAARTDPGQSLRWGDTAPGRRVLPGAAVLPLALSSLMGRPVRTLLTVAAIALPAALLMVLTFITRHLGGILYTTVTGQYAALEAGPVQYMMGLVALALAIVAAYDLVRQNAVDHRSERALLHALGWPRTWIALTMVAEAGLIGLIAALIGDLAGTAVLGVLYGPAVASAGQAALLAALPPLGLGLLTGAVSAVAESRFWNRAGLVGISERQVARFSPLTLIAGAAILLVACGGLLIKLHPQMPPGRGPGPSAVPPPAQQAPPLPAQHVPPLPSVDAGGVTVRYPEGMDKQMVTVAADRTRQAAGLLREKVGWTLGPAAYVELLEHRPTPTATATAADDGEAVRLAATDASLPLLLRGLARSAVIARSHGQAAGWLRDGLADYALERAGYAGRQARIDLLRPIGPVPFTQLANQTAAAMAQPRYERAVATAQLLADYLEQQQGAGAVTAVLDELAHDQSSMTAFAGAGGRSVTAVEEEFRAWLVRESAAEHRPEIPPDPTPWMAGYTHAAPPVRTQYRLDVTLDPDAFRLTGKQQVRFTNNEAVPLDSLYFHLFPNAPYFATGDRAGALTVQAVRADGQDVPFTGGKDEIMGLRLPKALAPGAAVTLDLTWEATVPDLPDRYGVDGGTIVLGNFYPILAMHDAGGWHLDRYVAAGDPFYSEVADYDVTFTAPAAYQIAATGHPDAAGRRFTAANVRDFAAAARRDWKLFEQTVDGVQIRYYWSKQDDRTVMPEAGLATAAGALHFFNEQFGPYPYQDLTIVNQQGMEYPQFVLAGSLTAVSHEVAHQWWYGVVGNDELRQLWDEGLTEFASLRYLTAAGQDRGRLFRMNNAAMDYTLYDYAVQPNTARPYGATIYGRGWRLWEALRSKMGDAAFTEMVRAFYAKHQYGIATWADWRDAVSAAGGPTAVTLFDAYVYGDQLPAIVPDAVAP